MTSLGSVPLVPVGAKSDVNTELLRGFHIARRDNATLGMFLHDLVHDDSRPFAGQTAIVTGATRGLGRGIAVVLLAAGVNLALPCRSQCPAGFQAELMLERDHLRKRLGAPTAAGAPSIKTYSMDLSDLVSVDSCVADMAASALRASMLINNAGLTTPYSLTTAQGYELQAGVNYLGTARFTLGVLGRGILASPGAPESERPARIVMVSSEEHRASNVLPLRERYPDLGSFCR
jgi:NAD(P)-dependent dehydrogenase (short-subunit alcohol dehydrogenase family)